MRRLAAALALLPAAGLAQTAEEAFAPVQGCLEAAADETAARACLGAFAQDCMAAPGGDSTAAMTACTVAEAGAWMRVLEEDFAAILMALRERAAVEEQSGTEPPPREEMLHQAQDAWVAFRDADCAYDVAVLSGGSIGQVAEAYCTLGHTAQRVLELRAKRADLERK